MILAFGSSLILATLMMVLACCAYLEEDKILNYSVQSCMLKMERGERGGRREEGEGGG